MSLALQVSALMSATGIRTVDQLRQKAVLDVACGSETSYSGTQFQPWLCRILTELGVHVEGIDIGLNPSASGWVCHHHDLVEPFPVSRLSREAYDIMTCTGFVHRAGGNDELITRRGRQAIHHAVMNVWQLAREVLAEDGQLVINRGKVYQKRGEEVVFSHRYGPGA